MKGQKKKTLRPTDTKEKTILVNSSERDVVLEAVNEAMIPQTALKGTRKIRRDRAHLR